jgi:replicative DNA helicase
MLSKGCADSLLPVLWADHFTSRPHQDTLEAIRAVHEAGRPVDPLLVHDQLRKQGRLAWGNIKAAPFIHTCVEATYFPGHAHNYAAAVLECAARRRLLQAGIRIAQAAARGVPDLPELMRLVAAEVHAVSDQVSTHLRIDRVGRAPVPLSDAVAELREQLTPATKEHAPQRSL